MKLAIVLSVFVTMMFIGITTAFHLGGKTKPNKPPEIKPIICTVELKASKKEVHVYEGEVVSENR